jgi:metal-responsive CopG/Arc/MetJ family transcriptional regulator
MEDEKDPRIITPMSKALIAIIDDFRFAERMPSRAEAIRRLIERGLQATQKNKSSEQEAK